MEWKSFYDSYPEEGQKVYYFGPNIGLFIGRYHYQERSFETYYYNEKNEKVVDKVLEACPHVLLNDNGGMCDAGDAPFWLPYDEEKAKWWCPIIPKEYTQNLYD